MKGMEEEHITGEKCFRLKRVNELITNDRIWIKMLSIVQTQNISQRIMW